MSTELDNLRDGDTADDGKDLVETASASLNTVKASFGR